MRCDLGERPCVGRCARAAPGGGRQKLTRTLFSDEKISRILEHVQVSWGNGYEKTTRGEMDAKRQMMVMESFSHF